jgi:RNA polymerase sigma-70 factor (ECF subfamily)
MDRLTEEDVLIKNGELSDEDLFLQSQKNPRLFEKLIDRYSAAFLRKAKVIMKEQELAEDVVQETFTKIYFKAHYFQSQGAGSFKSWGYKILVNTAYTHYQKIYKHKPAQLSEEMEDVLPDLGMIAFDEQKELADYVSSIFVRMPDHLASILNKFFLEGKSQEEIAKEEGLSVGAVKTRVYRAKEAFRNIMSSIA